MEIKMKKDYSGITEKEIRRKFPGISIVAGRSITSSITDEMFWKMQIYKEKLARREQL